MRRLSVTQVLSHLALAAWSAAAFAALGLGCVRAQEEPEAPVAVATDAEEAPPWQAKLDELREQLAALQKEFDELKSRPTPDAELEIKRLDEKFQILQSMLSKSEAAIRRDIEALRDFQASQDDIVEGYSRGEVKRLDEKVDSSQDTVIGWMNLYVSFAIALYLIVTGLIGFVLYYFGREKITKWIQEIIEKVTSQEVPEFIEQLRSQGKQEILRVGKRLDSRAEQEIEVFKSTLDEKIKSVVSRYETRPLDSLESPEEKAEVKELVQELESTKSSSEYTSTDWILTGLEAIKSENWEQGYEAFSAAIDKKPTEGEVYLFRGFALVQMERYEEALKNYIKAIELKPDFIPGSLSAAEMQIVRGEPAAAMASLTKAKPLIRTAKDRATSAYLSCIATALLGQDTTAAYAEFAESMKEDFERTWSTDIIEHWLEKAELDESVREYIREKTEQFKKK